MKIPTLNLLRKIRKSDTKPEITHYGMKFIIPENLTEDEILKSLVRIPAKNYKLPDNQGIALDFGGRSCSRRLILHMLNSIVWEKDLKILSWLSSNEESIKLFRSAGLCVTEPPAEIQKAHKPEHSDSNSESDSESESKSRENMKTENHVSALKVVYNSMRSGQKVETEGDVLVLGHLNPGAEVTAGGSIIVAGRLLGVVHAGGYGRGDVFVWAGSFETPQVRIGNKLCYADSKSTSCWRKCVVITLEDGTPVIRENKFMSMEKK